MKKSRKLIVGALVVMGLTLAVATTAHADAGDAAEDWATYVCHYLGFCSTTSDSAG
jgi:hypothetical protein